MIEPGCFSWVTLPPSAALSWMIIFIASASANGFPASTSAPSSTR